MLRLDLLKTHCTLIFGQWQWIILYMYTIGYLVRSLGYILLKYGQCQGFSQCRKTLATAVFGVVQHMFRTKVA